VNFDFTKEQKQLRQEVREFLTKELPVGWTKRIFKPMSEVPSSDEAWALQKRLAPKLAERGWLTMAWPKEYGGVNASHVTDVVFQEELYYHGAPGRDVFGIGLLGPILMRFGSEEQKVKHLIPIAKGEKFWCEGFSEPEAGSDLGAIKTRAVKEGDHFIIDGQKVWIGAAHRADWCFFLAVTDSNAPKRKGISFFLTDLMTPGITIRPITDLSGEQDLNEVFFDNVSIPKENLVGEENGGWQVAMSLLDYERARIENVAVGKRLIDELVEYAEETGIISNPLVRQQLASIRTEAEISRLLAYRVAWMQDTGLDCTCESSVSKIFSSHFIQHATATAMQLLELYSQLKEGSPWAPLGGRIPVLNLGSVGWTIAVGTTEIQKNIIAQRGLGLPRG